VTHITALANAEQCPTGLSATAPCSDDVQHSFLSGRVGSGVELLSPEVTHRQKGDIINLPQHGRRKCCGSWQSGD
jgi:hypothetical protein